MAGSPLRLDTIRVCGYRAFPYAIEIPLKGRSLILYGENGSGKSSLGKALRDFLDIRAGAVGFDDFRYRHAVPGCDNRFVTLSFTDSGMPTLNWTVEARDTSHSEFRDMARSIGWLDYRAIWRASDIQHGDTVEVFRALVEEILPGCQRGVSNETYGQTWERILQMQAVSPLKNRNEKWMWLRLQETLTDFNDSLRGFLPELQTEANKLLSRFVPQTAMELKWRFSSRYDSAKRDRKFLSGSIKLQMLDRDSLPLKTPSEFLNEARITAIGLCLYLAGMIRTIPPRRVDGTTYPKLLILDDVLLSLDMSHRLPLLTILREHFREWQVLLLTHDRAWYEIARQQLNGWTHQELFTQQVGDYEQPLLRIDQDHLGWAIDFLVQGHVKAAAVHVRTKFEEVLKRACIEFGIPVKYNPDPRKIAVSDFWAAVTSFSWKEIPRVNYGKNKLGERFGKPLYKTYPLIPQPLKERITHALSWVMNPLSHSQSVDRFRAEIEDAIFAVCELEQAIDLALEIQKTDPLLLRKKVLLQLSHSVSP